MRREMSTVGHWYRRPDTEELFQVVDCDEQSGIVRVQMFDGSLDEIEEDIWRVLSPEPVEPPGDWTGPLDNLDSGDFDELEGAANSEPVEDEYFRDDREPWESLLAAELTGIEGERSM